MARQDNESRRASSGEPATATHARGGAATPPLAAVVRVLGARATPTSLPLRAGTCVIGSGSACDVVVAEPTVSRMHVELSLVPEGVDVRDLSSRNGTYYLGQRVERMVLAFGGRLEIGAATVVVEPDTGAFAEAPLYDGETYRGIVGVSPAMRRVFAMLERLEGSLATILLEGESGVGKEVIARALHEGSPVSSGPLVVVNCGALPRELVASELFGHRRGAFTGAVETRRGAFEVADQGTLFLDEIGELPLDVQPMLLRALESGEVQRVGGEARHVKVRLIAATNRDLEHEVRSGSFREDLFYRLAVVRVTIPPLRERPDDIEPLARHFAEAAGLPELLPDVVERLKSKRWPGNARELRNAIQAYAALGVIPETPRVGASLMVLALRELADDARPYHELKEELVDRFTALYVESILRRAGGNQSLAARLAGLDRTHLGRLVTKHGRGKSG